MSTRSEHDDAVASMKAGEIKRELESYGISTKAFLEKSELVQALVQARAQGLQPKKEKESVSTTSTQAETSTSSDTSSRPREERLKEELDKCQQMKASELKRELEERGISTKSMFEKSEFVKALAEARIDNITSNKGQRGDENYAEYAEVEVLTDDSAGPRQQQDSNQQRSTGANPFGSAGANPFGGMGGMGNIADMLKNMGGMGGGGNPFGGTAGASPFGGGASPFGGGANPFGGGASPFGGAGGMGDAWGKAQEMMKNPKVMELMAKAQKNPRFMQAMQECMSNPAAFAKYQNDPEIGSLINELRKYM